MLVQPLQALHREAFVHGRKRRLVDHRERRERIRPGGGQRRGVVRAREGGREWKQRVVWGCTTPAALAAAAF